MTMLGTAFITIAASLGAADGSFALYAPLRNTPIVLGNTGLEDVALGDFNCDGLTDIAAPGYNGQILIARNQGDYFTALTEASGRTFLRSAAAGDFNGDGCDDLAAVDSAVPGYTVALLGTSSGFAPAPGSPIATPFIPWGVDAADFNADGLDDIVSAEASNDLAYVFLARPQGGFSAATTYPLGRNSIHVEVGDFDDNGTQDIFSTNHNWFTATVLLNNGSAGFAPAFSSPLPILHTPCRPIAVDLNADGNTDIVLRSGERYQIGVYYGDGAGQFQPVEILDSELPFGCEQFAVGDLDGNGMLDLVIPFGDRMRFLYQQTDGTFLTHTSERLSGVIFRGLSTFDFGSDGALEIVAGAQRGDESLVLVLGQILFASGFE